MNYGILLLICFIYKIILHLPAKFLVQSDERRNDECQLCSRDQRFGNDKAQDNNILLSEIQ